MKRFISAGLLTMVLAFPSYANALLQNKGCGLMVDGVCQGNLIYDTVAKVTWFDYTYKGPCPVAYDGATFKEATDWANGLTVAGVSNWQLPSMSLPPNCISLSNVDCIASNFTCPACIPPSDDANYNYTSNAAGSLYWLSLPAWTIPPAYGGTGPFASMDTRSGKFYWTSSSVLTYPFVLSYSNGYVQPATNSDARYYAMAMHVGEVTPAVQTAVAQVQTNLTDYRELITDEKDAAILEDAILHLAKAQDQALWILNNEGIYVLRPESGKTAFSEAKLAVKSLNVLIAGGYPLQRFVDEIIYVGRLLAQNAIDDAGAADNGTAKAKYEMGKATENAVARYSKAWESATKGGTEASIPPAVERLPTKSGNR